jgi:hypothetical protein
MGSYYLLNFDKFEMLRLVFFLVWGWPFRNTTKIAVFPSRWAGITWAGPKMQNTEPVGPRINAVHCLTAKEAPRAGTMALPLRFPL